MIQDGRDFVVMDGQKYGGELSSNEDLAFSPDGRRFAYVACDNGDWIVVCGDQRSERFDIVRDPVFRRHGKKVAFGARKGRELWWKVMEVK